MADTASAEEKRLEPTVETEEIGPSKLRMKIRIDAAKVTERIEKKYRELNEKMAIPGFRPGKAPRAILERKYGKSILEEAKFELLNQSYEEAREAKSLEPLGEPEIDVEKIELKSGEPLAYELAVEVKPVIEVKPFEGLTAKQPPVVVADAEIDKALEDMRAERAELVPADGAAQAGDHVVADFELIVDGASINKTENGQVVLQSDITFFGRELPDFHEKVVGAKAGDVVEYAMTLPADFHDAKAAGKNGVIRTTVKSVKRRQLPAADAEFAKQFDFDSIDELRADIAKKLKRDKERDARRQVGEELLVQVMKANDFQLPAGYLKGQEEMLEARLVSEHLMKGQSEEQARASAAEELASAKANLEHAIKEELLVESIAKKEKIFVTEDQVDEKLQQIAVSMAQPFDEVRAYFEQQGWLHQMRRSMRTDAVREFLISKAAVE